MYPTLKRPGSFLLLPCLSITFTSNGEKPGSHHLPPPFTVIQLNLRTAWLQTCEATPQGKQLHHLEGGLGLALLLLRGLPLVLVNLSSSRVTLASISITPNRLHSTFHAYSCPVLGFFLTLCLLS